MDNHSLDPDETPSEHPPPTDFDRFLPWACGQLGVDVSVTVIRSIQVPYVSAAQDRTKLKPKLSKPKSPVSELVADIITPKHNETAMAFSVSLMGNEKPIVVESIYDGNLNLVQLKFLKNRSIPRQIFKIIALIIPFHKSLNSITINSGLHVGAMYEISKILPLSSIRELCLDNTFLAEANYHILLRQGSIKHLSLSKCKITDTVLATIAAQLAYPYPASKTLSVLNLATNRITDSGVKLLADALRTNRQLIYLNLSDNMITDKGAMSLFDILVEFPLTNSENMDRSDRLMSYLKEKRELTLKTLKELQSGEFEKKIQKRNKSNKPTVASQNKSNSIDKETMTVDSKSIGNMEALYTEKAQSVAEGILGPFDDPFNSDNTVITANSLNCIGNYTLCYLNLAYNDLTYFSLRKLLDVLLTQKIVGRKSRGLLNVNIEGNLLPAECPELHQIDELLETGLASFEKLNARKKSLGVRASRN